MRKVILAAVLAALGSAALAVPASGSFDHHCPVFENRASMCCRTNACSRSEGSTIHSITTTGSVATMVGARSGRRRGKVSRGHHPQR